MTVMSIANPKTAKIALLAILASIAAGAALGSKVPVGVIDTVTLLGCISLVASMFLSSNIIGKACIVAFSCSAAPALAYQLTEAYPPMVLTLVFSVMTGIFSIDRILR